MECCVGVFIETVYKQLNFKILLRSELRKNIKKTDVSDCSSSSERFILWSRNTSDTVLFLLENNFTSILLKNFY